MGVKPNKRTKAVADDWLASFFDLLTKTECIGVNSVAMLGLSDRQMRGCA